MAATATASQVDEEVYYIGNYQMKKAPISNSYSVIENGVQIDEFTIEGEGDRRFRLVGDGNLIYATAGDAIDAITDIINDL